MEHANPDVATTGRASGNEAGAKAPSKRAKPKRNSEARKQQNREASKTYRQKRKQKLELLNELLGKPQDGSTTPSSPAHPTPPAYALGLEAVTSPPLPGAHFLLKQQGAPPTAGPLDEPLFDNSWQTLGQDRLSDVLNPSLNHPIEDLPAPTGADTYNAFMFNPDPSQGLDPQLLANPDHLSAQHPLFTPISSIFSPFSQLPNLFAVPHAEEHPPATVSADTEEVIRTSPPQLDDSPVPEPYQQVIESFSRLNPSQQRQLLDTLAKKGSDGSRPTSRGKGKGGAKSRGATPTDGPDLLLNAMIRVSKAGSPDPVGQCMRLGPLSFFAAIFENAVAIGLARKKMLVEEASLSPFDLVPSGNPAAVELVQAKFASVAKDLRPTPSQITLPHHPYLDVIPFPDFREKALAALACNPPLFDESDMCDDMCQEALVCWGSQGSGERGSGGMAAGVPWDARSWEPKPWFLKKYWFLVGGWEDEMWKAARWWHGMRNERLDVGVV